MRTNKTRQIVIPALLLASFTASLLTRAQSPESATLTIRTAGPSSKVSPMLYGLMTEEINHSYEGGLYAEMVRNSTFHGDWTGIPDWILVEKGNAQAKIEIDKTTGPSVALPYSLRLDADVASESSPAGLLNTGFWGMALQPDTVYQGSFYAREDGASAGPVTASLVANDSGQVLASAVVSDIGKDWKQHTFALKTGAMQASMNNHLALTVAHPGTLWLNLATLFPPTYHDRPNGTRIDLMEKMAAMQPAFLRFPGGNFLEGNHLADWYDWKKTIGPLVDRPGHPSPWSYWSTDGFGLLEFFEWCEDLHMKPVLAVYAGYSLMHDRVTPGPDLDPYVQSALDEIEYAAGAADTRWGARRVADGHPKPFQIAYVEIGNEDQFDTSGSYDARFAQFQKAIKLKYPDLPLIATTPLKSGQADVLDDHYYLRATTFFHDAKHYDKTDRAGQKIFVGEWATREGVPTPNFGAALGDAAWMTGLERNSDIIVMSCYAPLLVNVSPGAMQWDTDLIGYNASKSYGSPSYYLQVMFARYLGNETPQSSLQTAPERFFYSVTQDTGKKKLYLKLVNGSSDARSIDILLPDTNPGAEGKLVSLTAPNTQATNTIDEPTKIMPVETAFRVTGKKLRHEMPGYSIQVLVFDLQ